MKDGDGDGRQQFPLSMLLCAGTQAETALQNRYNTPAAHFYITALELPDYYCTFMLQTKQRGNNLQTKIPDFICSGECFVVLVQVIENKFFLHSVINN